MPEPEVWRPVPGFPKYEVSNLGEVRSSWFKRPRTLKPRYDSSGYRHVRLFRDRGVSDNVRVHSILAAAFIGPRPHGAQIRHLDGVKTHNTPSNLRYGSASENARDSVTHGTHHMTRKTHCSHGHAFDEANTYISGGQRCCRTCVRTRSRTRRAAQWKAVA